MSQQFSLRNSGQSNSKYSKSERDAQRSKNNELQQLILQNQNFSQEYKGYYTITQWRKLNQLLFNPTEYQQKTTITNCWRLMKLINFGDEIIPTGLIFDCIMTLMNVDQTVDHTQVLLKAIFLKFIELNGKFLTQKQREDLAFFRVVKTVAEGYRKIIADKLDVENTSENEDDVDRPQDRNQQLYLLHGVITYKKDLKKLKKIQTQFKECSFQPKINEHSAEIGQSRYMTSSKKKIQPQVKEKNYGIIDESQQYFEASRLDQRFKAKPLPNFTQFQPPRQYFDHVQRIRKSRQIKSINSLSRRAPQSSEIRQFSIQQRQEQRKRNKLQNVRILFMIKVEVGKRIYRVKVRQNMGVSETVKAIQKMVGFKSNEIVEVVKGYFLNWQRRQRAKLQNSRDIIVSQDVF